MKLLEPNMRVFWLGLLVFYFVDILRLSGVSSSIFESKFEKFLSYWKQYQEIIATFILSQQWERFNRAQVGTDVV